MVPFSGGVKKSQQDNTSRTCGDQKGIRGANINDMKALTALGLFAATIRAGGV